MVQLAAADQGEGRMECEEMNPVTGRLCGKLVTIVKLMIDGAATRLCSECALKRWAKAMGRKQRERSS